MTTGVMALLGVAVLFIGLIVTLVIPEIYVVSLILLAVGVVFIAVAVVLDYRRVGRAIVSRRGRFGTGTTLMVSVFTGIILLANAISAGNFYRFDATGLSQYTLTSQTKDVLANLDETVEIIQFNVPNDELGIGAYASTLLAEYQNFTDKLKVTVIDPDEHPDQARQYDITEYQTVVFIGADGERVVPPVLIYIEAEHAFTRAILEVTGTVQLRLYFITGHGESGIDDTTPAGYSSAVEGLRDNLYQAFELDLLRADRVPDDAAALVLVAPKDEVPLAEREIQLIQQYLLDGGRLAILGNPDTPKEVLELMAPWGFVLSPGTVVDPASYTAPNVDNPSVPRTHNAFGLDTTYFPGAAAIIPLEVPENFPLLPQPLVVTSDESWLEMDLQPNVDPTHDPEELPGPLWLGALVPTMQPPATADGEWTENFEATRLVVFGDSDFASNKHFFNGGNSDLFLSSISWLSAGSELISIDRKFLQTRALILQPEAKTFIDISSVALLPALVFIAGGIIWYRRR